MTARCFRRIVSDIVQKEDSVPRVPTHIQRTQFLANHIYELVKDIDRHRAAELELLTFQIIMELRRWSCSISEMIFCVPICNMTFEALT